MTSPTGRDLGTATGRIIIDVSSLQNASQIAQQVAKEIGAAFASVNVNLSNVATIAKAWGQAQAAAYREAAAEAKRKAVEVEAAARLEQTAMEAASRSETNAAKISVQASKERIAELRALGNEATRVANQMQTAAELMSKGSSGGQVGLLGNLGTGGALAGFSRQLEELQKSEARALEQVAKQPVPNPMAGLLAQNDLATTTAFMRELQQIQSAEAGQRQANLSITQSITEQLRAQLPIAQRLSEAAAARRNQESGTLADLRAEINTQNRPPSPAGQGGAGQAYRFPTFIQFAAYPAGQLLSSFGATGAASAVMTGGALAGLIDQLPLLGFQIQTLAGRITGLGGVVGTLARVGAGAELALAGTATGLGAILAVAAPLVIALVGVAAIMAEIQRQAEVVNQVLREQADLNKQIAGGATSSDLQAQRDQTQRERDAAQRTLEQFQSLENRFQQYRTSPESVSDMGAILTGSPVSAELTALKQELSDLTGGATDNLTGLYQLIDGQQKIVDEYAVSIGLLNANMKNGSTAANDMATLNDQLAKSWVDVAQQERELSRLNLEQLQQRQQAGQSELASINEALALAPQLSEEQRKIFEKRQADLETEYLLIQKLLPAARQAELTDFINKAQAAYDAFALQGGRTAEDRQIAAGDTAQDRGIQAQRRAQDFTIQRSQANEDFQRQQLRSAEDYYDARAKQERDYGRDSLERQQELQDKLAQIISDSRIKILEAAARLDARGVFEEQRRRDQQLADTRDTAQKEQQQRADAFRQQLEDQRAQYEKQRQRAEQDFALRIQREDAQRALQEQRRLEDEAIQVQREVRNNALRDQRQREDFARQVASYAQHYGALANIQNIYTQVMQQNWGAFLASMAAQVNPYNLRGGAGGGGLTYNTSGGGGGGTSRINATLQGFNYGAGQYPATFTGTPFRDFGGEGVAGRMYIIGRGAQPEAFIAPSNGQFIPNADRMLGKTEVHLHGDIVLGDIGDYSRSEIIALVNQGVDKGFRTFFERGLARG